jgi:hypothetical protein
MMKSLRSTLQVSVLASLVLAASARSAFAADVAPKTSIVTLVDHGQQWLLAAAAGPTVASEPTMRSTAGAETAVRPVGPERQPAAEEQSIFDLTPNASVVARDWRGSLKIVGARTMLVDDLRPTASNRMVIGRVATNAARISLFAQVGAGEWRVDTVMFPGAVSYSELAGQLGGGFELHLAPRLRVAGEIQYTMLARDLHYSEGEVAPRMTSYVIAAAGTF